MNYLVTGAAGFIGFHVSLALLKRGDAVVGVDNLNDYYDPQLKQARLKLLLATGDRRPETGDGGPRTRDEERRTEDRRPGTGDEGRGTREEGRRTRDEGRRNEDQGRGTKDKGTGRGDFRFEQLDIADRAAIAELFSQEHPDRVVHLAAQAGVRYSIDHPHAYVDSNLVGFVNVLEGCRHSGVEHLVYASSSSVYGANQKLPFSIEDNVDHPVSLYGATKKANELMAHAYSHLFGLPVTGLRFFTVYGPWGRPDMAYFTFTKAILEGRPINVYNYGYMKRDFTYIDDIVEAVVRVADRPPTGDRGPKTEDEVKVKAKVKSGQAGPNSTSTLTSACSSTSTSTSTYPPSSDVPNQEPETKNQEPAAHAAARQVEDEAKVKAKAAKEPASAPFSTLTSTSTSACPYKLYNIGNHTPIDLPYFIEVLEKAIGKKAAKNSLPMQPGDVLATFADVDDLARDVGFAPSTPIEVGIRRFVDWYREYYRIRDQVKAEVEVKARSQKPETRN